MKTLAPQETLTVSRCQERTLRIRGLALLGMVLLLCSVAPAPPSRAASPPSPAGPHVLAADDRHIVLEWAAPAYDISRQKVQGQSFDQVSQPGCPPAGEPGEPQLPACTVLLGIPPDASLSLSVLEQETAEVPGTYRLLPVPEPDIQENPLAEGPAGVQVTGEKWVEGPVYAGATLFPQQPAALGQPAFLRHQRMVPVTFYPLQYRPQSGELLYHPRLRLEITFRDAREPAGFLPEPPAFEDLLSDNLLNYSQARNWRRTSRMPLELPPVPPDPGYRIPVRRAGIYRLTYQRLQAAGLPVGTLDPRTLRLFRYGQEVAIRVLGEEDGHFDLTDAVLFYGQPIRHNRYTDTEVYWLTYGGVPGRRMGRRDGTPHGTAPLPPAFAATEHREENALYYFQIPWRPDHDHWLWNYTYPEGKIPQQTYTFPAHPLAGGSYTATLRMYLCSYTQDPSVDPDHHIRAFVNGVLVSELWWDGRVDLTPTLSFASALLQPSGNSVRVEAPADTGAFADLVFYDWLELGERRLFAAELDRLDWNGEAGSYEYHLTSFSQSQIRLFDVTDPDGPIEVVSTTVVNAGSSFDLHFEDAATGTTAYLAMAEGKLLQPESVTAAAPADLRDPANGADYLIVSHGNFRTQALSLAAFRAGQGLRTQVVDVQDVYDLFAYGRRVPEAIRGFLAYTYENWGTPAPSYVILLGDGHYDFKNYLGYGMGNYVIPYLGFVDPWIGETAADNRYVCLSGSDTIPDMHLGRLPANTAAQAQVMVDKIVNYEQMPPPGDWRMRTLFVADNADSAGNFAALSEALINGYYPPPYQAERVYLGVTHSLTAARQAIIDGINAGRLLVNYIGHGGPGLWASEALLNNAALSSLVNGPYFPVALPMTCYEGYYISPQSNSSFFALSEQFLRAQGKGWVASWSPAGLGVATGHHFLNEGFLTSLFRDDDPRLGPATLAGKLRLYASGGNLELLDTYLLLGDPALAIPLLPTDLALHKAVEPATPLRPGDLVTFTLTLANSGPATAHHVVLTDTLPSLLVNPTVTAVGVVLTPRPGPAYAWVVSDIAGGQASTVTIAGRVSLHASAGFVTNAASVSTSATETDVGNNLDWVTLLVAAGPADQITVTVQPPALPADGTSLALIRALVLDQAGNPAADGTPVYFHTTAGTFLEGAFTDTVATHLGVAEALLRAGSEVATATASVASGTAWSQLHVPFIPLPPYSIAVSAVPSTIPVTGTAQITATVQDILGHPIADGTPVTFTTSLGTIAPTLAATQDGLATASLQAGGQDGLAIVVARSGGAAGAATVRIGAGAGLTLTLEVTPTQLPAAGHSWATVTATLRGSGGTPVSGTAWISFSTTLGDIPSRSLAVSGTAVVSLTAGTAPGQAIVVAMAGGASAWAEVRLLPGAAARLALTAVPPAVPAGGHRALATARVEDAWGNPVADGTALTLTTSLGILTPTSGATWAGEFQTLLTSGTEAGTATLTAQSGVATGTTAVRFLPLLPYTLTLSADPLILVADGVSTSTLSAWVQDRFGNPVADGTIVQMLTTLGLVWPAKGVTNQGWATATLQTGTELGTASIHALAGAAQGQAQVSLVPGPPAVVLVTANPTSLVANGVSTATVTVHVQDAFGHGVANGTPVSLTTSLGSITPQAASTHDGQVVATLRTGLVPGWARVGVESGKAWGETWVGFLWHLALPLVLRRGP